MHKNFPTQYFKSLQPNLPDRGSTQEGNPPMVLFWVSAPIWGKQGVTTASVSALYSLPFEGNWSLIFIFQLLLLFLKLVLCVIKGSSVCSFYLKGKYYLLIYQWRFGTFETQETEVHPNTGWFCSLNEVRGTGYTKGLEDNSVIEKINWNKNLRTLCMFT